MAILRGNLMFCKRKYDVKFKQKSKPPLMRILQFTLVLLDIRSGSVEFRKNTPVVV